MKLNCNAEIVPDMFGRLVELRTKEGSIIQGFLVSTILGIVEIVPTFIATKPGTLIDRSPVEYCYDICFGRR